MSVFERLKNLRVVTKKSAEIQPVTGENVANQEANLEDATEKLEAERAEKIENLRRVPFAGEKKTKNEELDEWKRATLFEMPNAVEQYGLEEVNERIGFKGEDAKHERRILAFMTGKGFNNYMAANEETIGKFLDKYPTVMDFNEPSENFLKMIGNGNSPQKLEEYEFAMHNLLLHVYGRQYQKWLEIRHLTRVPEEDGIEDGESDSLPGIEIDGEGDSLPRIEVGGDMWIEDRQGRILTAEVLKDNGLAPKYNMGKYGKDIEFSEAWKVGGREAVAAYVKNEDGSTKVENYYRNGARKYWRRLSEYVIGEGKYPGEDDESTVAEENMQKVLSAIARFGEYAKVKDDPKFLLEGAARRYDSMEEYRKESNGS